MAKSCVFCGQRPVAKNKEHVIPEWLIKATGKPGRLASFGTFHPTSSAPKVFAFDQLVFPACTTCNEGFGRTEDQAKRVIDRMFSEQPLAAQDFDVLLDWLDKVRVGMWLGMMYLEGNPWEIVPKFHISARVGLRDRTVGIARIEGRQSGINLVGPESPCFGLSPTAMCLLINDVALFNSSAIDLCSRRLGFPFATRFQPQSDGRMQCEVQPGLERILIPVQRFSYRPSMPFIYQPILERTMREPPDPYDCDYVRANCLDLEAGRGSLFLQRDGLVAVYGAAASKRWIPDSAVPLQEAYAYARRWAYRQLEYYFRSQVGRRNTFAKNIPRWHRLLISRYDDLYGKGPRGTASSFQWNP